MYHSPLEKRSSPSQTLAGITPPPSPGRDLTPHKRLGGYKIGGANTSKTRGQRSVWPLKGKRLATGPQPPAVMSTGMRGADRP